MLRIVWQMAVITTVVHKYISLIVSWVYPCIQYDSVMNVGLSIDIKCVL